MNGGPLFVRSRDSLACIQSLLAIARAYAREPSFQSAKACDAAASIDAAIRPYRTIEAIVALAVVLLRGLGVDVSSLTSRIRSDG
jgi:hypothetical protein